MLYSFSNMWCLISGNHYLLLNSLQYNVSTLLTNQSITLWSYYSKIITQSSSSTGHFYTHCSVTDCPPLSLRLPPLRICLRSRSNIFDIGYPRDNNIIIVEKLLTKDYLITCFVSAIYQILLTRSRKWK